LSQSLANFAGPALAGWLVQLVGAAATLTLDALSYLWSALMVSLISAADEPPSSIKRPHPLRDIASRRLVILKKVLSSMTALV